MPPQKSLLFASMDFVKPGHGNGLLISPCVLPSSVLVSFVTCQLFVHTVQSASSYFCINSVKNWFHLKRGLFRYPPGGNECWLPGNRCRGLPGMDRSCEDVFPSVYCTEDIRCYIDEILWPNHQERMDCLFLYCGL
ncbi:hypothetical protein QTP70_031556 [Hemibagrus guttatus]|uniref:Uncharacterized protein n=1 Tax=Hemibagrus guttatus TaxID=175788 RepID=A0AAE0RFI3_9TELE|nr:hypothetical protein QTP70_031556 [Hemibagrus guttatus]KAK3571628.1 hypothetical protein QTP86_015364 [Hemibagrus guttatus]